MPILSRTMTTSAPIDAVYGYLADFSNGPEWDPGQESSVARETGSPREGLVYDVMVLWGSRKLPMVYTIEQIDPPNSVVLVGEGSTTVAIDTLEFEPAPDGGTTVTYTADIRLKGPLRLVEPLLRSKFADLADAAEAGIVEQLNRLAGANGEDHSHTS